jgi:hypothetical protein
VGQLLVRCGLGADRIAVLLLVRLHPMNSLMSWVSELEQLAKSRLQHLQPENVEFERKRMLEFADHMDTARQLAQYGVKL